MRDKLGKQLSAASSMTWQGRKQAYQSWRYVSAPCRGAADAWYAAEMVEWRECAVAGRAGTVRPRRVMSRGRLGDSAQGACVHTTAESWHCGHCGHCGRATLGTAPGGSCWKHMGTGSGRSRRGSGEHTSPARGLDVAGGRQNADRRRKGRRGGRCCRCGGGSGHARHSSAASAWVGAWVAAVNVNVNYLHYIIIMCSTDRTDKAVSDAVSLGWCRDVGSAALGCMPSFTGMPTCMIVFTAAAQRRDLAVRVLCGSRVLCGGAGFCGGGGAGFCEALHMPGWKKLGTAGELWPVSSWRCTRGIG